MSAGVGVRFDGFDTVGDTVETAALAEEAGADTIWMAEHLGYRAATVSCMAFLQCTRHRHSDRGDAVSLAPDADGHAVRHHGRALARTSWHLRVGRQPPEPAGVGRFDAAASGSRDPRVCRGPAGTLGWRDGRTGRSGLAASRCQFCVPAAAGDTGLRCPHRPPGAGAGRADADGVLFSGGLLLAYTRRCAELQRS